MKCGKAALSVGSHAAVKWSTPPIAESLLKGSRVEVQDGDRIYEGVIIQIGARDRAGQVHVQHVQAPGAELDNSDERSWRSVSDLRPIPPEPPQRWLCNLVPHDVLSAQLPDGDGTWVNVGFKELILPATDQDEPMADVFRLDDSYSYRTSAKSLRPLWSFATDTSVWSMQQRRSGPIGDEPMPSAVFSIGEQVEIAQEDSGFEGSYYTADLLEVHEDDQRACVRYHAFDEDVRHTAAKLPFASITCTPLACVTCGPLNLFVAVDSMLTGKHGCKAHRLGTCPPASPFAAMHPA